MNTSVSPKGQATIPMPIRKKFKIEPGTKIEWEVDTENNVILLYPVNNEKTTNDWVDEACGMFAGSDMLEEYLAEKHKEVEKEYRTLKPNSK
ncbi:AbrB/MazE/SpoVT family DNA-binding domain-containing protein [Candidatus Peregrinibacteria bacterium]|jgi:AbrB family looped-hinge helix DNA binding protein|nr:AbrB/MazE/SpoVT family DNA-binding domain-containing protein [Candidatus Peregrinibacteria bacterium]MBT7483912.1 AbrB/MazE/SpoVT family DNA-binding domain-containing protein [Candidatus Peregrinibacteria bacterium]MBT7703061.1 AbrB/MazE/SpoVT family DNA-binding domain-containing protein [Candidatus Peregrinibacteria bacterium]